jgi:hypothetical protein
LWGSEGDGSDQMGVSMIRLIKIHFFV